MRSKGDGDVKVARLEIIDFEPNSDRETSRWTVKTDETHPKPLHVVEREKIKVHRVINCELRESDMKQNNLPIGIATTGVSTTVRHDGYVFFLGSEGDGRISK